MQNMAKAPSAMSIWIDKQGRKHVGIMVGGKRMHRELPEGATAREAKLIEAEIRASVARSPQQVKIPGEPSMAAVLALYVEHAKTLRSSETSTYHAMRLGPWAEKYKASQAQEFAEHVIKDMRDVYAHATINRSLACATKGLTIAWKQRLTTENYGLRIDSMPVNNKREVFLTVDQVAA
jgi:hypothetical protein